MENKVDCIEKFRQNLLFGKFSKICNFWVAVTNLLLKTESKMSLERHCFFTHSNYTIHSLGFRKMKSSLVSINSERWPSYSFMRAKLWRKKVAAVFCLFVFWFKYYIFVNLYLQSCHSVMKFFVLYAWRIKWDTKNKYGTNISSYSWKNSHSIWNRIVELYQLNVSHHPILYQFIILNFTMSDQAENSHLMEKCLYFIFSVLVSLKIFYNFNIKRWNEYYLHWTFYIVFIFVIFWKFEDICLNDKIDIWVCPLDAQSSSSSSSS